MMAAGSGSAVPVAKELVLIGGGHSHAFVIKNLGMRAEPGVRVTLVTQQVDTPYSGMLPGHVSGKYSRAECHIDLVRLCRFGNVRLVVATVVGLDLASKTVLLAGREAPLRYDVLSIDVGCLPSPVPRDPVSRNALAPTPVKPISGFSTRWEELVETIRARVSARLGAAEAGAAASGRGAAADGPAAAAAAAGSSAGAGRLTVAVVGAGAGGVELALSMQERLAREAPQCVPRFVLVSNASTICPSHNASVQQRFQRLLLERGVEVIYGFEAVGVRDGMLVAEDGRTLRADEAVWCTSARAQAWLGSAGLSVDAHGFVRVKATLESESHAGVFAAGDCAHVVPHPRAKAGVFAVRQGPPLTENLRRVLRQQLGIASS
jgi:selenide,water dikinase